MKYYIVFEGGKIYYSDKGQGDAIVLLHGYLESSEIWNNFARKLALNFRVISVDLPGHGLSKVYGDCHTMEFMASAIKGLTDCLQLKKIFLMGHSMGGYVTLAFLELYPEMLGGYCLFHSHPFADSSETLRIRENEIRMVRSGKKYLLYPENITRMYATSNFEKLSDQIQRSKDIASTVRDEGIIAVLNGMMARPPRVSVMEKGKVPGLWILGSMDKIIDAGAVTKQVKLPANASVAILENSGHMGFIEEEELSAKIVTGFFAGKK